MYIDYIVKIIKKVQNRGTFLAFQSLLTHAYTRTYARTHAHPHTHTHINT